MKIFFSLIRTAPSSALTIFLCLAFALNIVAQTKPNEGTIKLDDTYSPQAELMAHRAVTGASNVIAKKVCAAVNRNTAIVIYDAEMKIQLIQYRNSMRLLNLYKVGLEREINAIDLSRLSPEQVAIAVELAMAQGGGEHAFVAEAAEIAGALTGATGALSAVGDLMGFFKTNVEEKGFKADFTKEKLIPIVAEQLLAECSTRSVTIHHPKEMPFSLSAGNSDFATLLDTVVSLRYKAENLTNILKGLRMSRTANETRIAKEKLDLAKARDDLKAATDSKVIAVLQAKIRELGQSITALETESRTQLLIFTTFATQNNALLALIKQTDGFASTLLKAEDKSPTPLLLSIFESEQVSRALTGGYALEIAANSAGSTRRIKRNLFLDLFFTSERVKFNGAAAIRYTLYENSEVKQACVVNTYIDFHKTKKIFQSRNAFSECATFLNP